MAEKEKGEEKWKFEFGTRHKYLAIAAVFLVIGFVINGSVFTGQVIGAMSPEDVGEKVIDYINNNLVQAGEIASLVSVEDMGGLYEVTTSYKGQEIQVYSSKDGKYLLVLGVPGLGLLDLDVDLNLEPETPQGEGVPKTDRPEVELYIFSYCPAGSAALDSFAEVADFLKDSADFQVKFFSHMHGEYEKQQNMIQECIQRIAPDRYWDYANLFVEEVYQNCAPTRSQECDMEKSTALMTSLGINSQAVLDCVEQNGEQYYQEDQNDASALQLRYSPSFVINGVYLSSISRTPEGIKQEVCPAFNTPPDECSVTLSASGTSATGGCG